MSTPHSVIAFLSKMCYNNIREYAPKSLIMRETIHMPEKQVKSKQRVADHGEVFTAEREVNAMLDLVKQETERRFLQLKNVESPTLIKEFGIVRVSR